MTAPELYHFTCHDGKKQIGTSNCLLMPQRGAWEFVWLTDEAEPDFEAMGLGEPVLLKCDRREFRYIVAAGSRCRPWIGSPQRRQLDWRHCLTLESYAKPEHWWISTEPVLAVFDREYRPAGHSSPSGAGEGAEGRAQARRNCR